MTAVVLDALEVKVSAALHALGRTEAEAAGTLHGWGFTGRAETTGLCVIAAYLATVVAPGSKVRVLEHSVQVTEPDGLSCDVTPPGPVQALIRGVDAGVWPQLVTSC